MPVHVDEMTTEVVPLASDPAPGRPEERPGEPEWNALANLRSHAKRLREVEERTAAEGFCD